MRRACLPRRRRLQEKHRAVPVRGAARSRRSMVRSRAARAGRASLARREAQSARVQSARAAAGQVAQLRAAPRPESPAWRRAGSDASATRSGSGGPARVPSGVRAPKRSAQMAEARHAGSKRELLTADAVRQGLEEGRKSLRPQPRRSAGRARRTLAACRTRCQNGARSGSSGEQPRHERSIARRSWTRAAPLKGNPRSRAVFRSGGQVPERERPAAHVPSSSRDR
jgi:hypothetical protein